MRGVRLAGLVAGWLLARTAARIPAAELRTVTWGVCLVKDIRELGDGQHLALRERQLLDDTLDTGADLLRDERLVAQIRRRNVGVVQRAVGADFEHELHATADLTCVGEVTAVDVGSERLENLVHFGPLEPALVGVSRLERDRGGQNE